MIQQGQFPIIADELPVNVVVVAPDGIIQAANRVSAQLFGYDNEEIVGMPVFNLYAKGPLGVEKARELFARFCAGEEIQGEDLQIQRRNGETRWIRLYVHPVLTATGQVSASRSVPIDITAEKELAAENEAELELLAKLVQYSPEAIFVIDPENDRILWACQKAAAMLKYDQSELLSVPVSSLHPNDLLQLQEFVQGIFAEGYRWTDVLTCMCKDGTVLPAEIAGSLVTWQGRQVILAIVTDVSRVKDVNENLTRKVQELAALSQLFRQHIDQRNTVDELFDSLTANIAKLAEVTEGVASVVGAFTRDAQKMKNRLTPPGI